MQKPNRCDLPRQNSFIKTTSPQSILHPTREKNRWSNSSRDSPRVPWHTPSAFATEPSPANHRPPIINERSWQRLAVKNLRRRLYASLGLKRAESTKLQREQA